METVTSYKCDYCKKVYANKNHCKEHEFQCFHNPKNKACITCKHGKSPFWDSRKCQKTGGNIMKCKDWEEIVHIEKGDW